MIVAALAMPAGAAAAPLANDPFDGALELAGAETSTTGSNVQASAEPGEPRHAGYTASRSVWWRWTAPAAGAVRVDTCGSSFDTVLAVYSNAAGGDLGALTEVASNDDGGDCGLQSVVSFEALAGETYAIAVDGYSGATGEIALQLGGVPAPANDHFADAEELDPSLGDGYRTGTTLAATREPDEPSHAAADAVASVWYRWTASESGTVVASTCGGWWSAFAGSDTVLAAYTGAQLADLVELAGNDDGGGCFTSGGSRIGFAVTAGTVYHLAVAGKGEAAVDFELEVSPPPLNDAFDAAEELTDYAYGSTARATSEPGEPGHAGSPAASSLWYSWTAATDAPVEVALCAYEPLDPRLAVYIGDELTALTDVATGQPGGCSGVDETGVVATFEAEAGTTYRIAVDSLDDLEGHFELSVSPPPVNDLFADALELGESGRLGRNVLASKEPAEPEHAANAGGHSLWYRWTASATGEFALATCTANFDTLLAVYSGTEMGNLTEVASNDDSDECGGAPTRSSLRVNAVAGETYWIAVDGKDGATGQFTVYFHNQPYNDPFDAPEAIGPGSWGGTTTLATKQPGEPNHAGDAGGHSVWYRWSSAGTGAARVRVCEAGFDSLLAVYRRGPGDGFESLTEVAHDDDTAGCGAGGSGSQVSFQTEAGADYLIAVDSKNGSSGDFELDLAEAPANDAFASAIEVAEAPYYGVSAHGSNVAATKEDGEPDHADESGGHSVWYRWTTQSSGSYAVETCSAEGFDTVLGVYTGALVSALTEVGSDDDGCGSGSTASTAVFEANAGTTYRIAVDGKSSAVGPFTLRIVERPGNDDLAAAAALDPRVFPVPQSIAAATKEEGEPDHAGDGGGRSVWYRWTATRSGIVEIATCQPFFFGQLDTVLAVYAGTEYGALTPVAFDDDTFDCGDGRQSRVVFAAVEGMEYRIAVDGKDGAVGDFAIALYDAPVNDAFEDATSLTAPSPYVFEDTIASSKQAGEPDHGGDPGGRSVWYRYSADRDEQVTLQSCFADFAVLVAVYEGAALDDLSPVGAPVPSTENCFGGAQDVVFTAEVGNDYWIAVDGEGGAAGRFELNFLLAPANDAFVDAQPLGGASAAVTENSARATKETGEGDHGGNQGGSSVWYRWTAPESGPALVETCDTDFDTLLGVYTGSSVETAELVAESDDSPACGSGSGSRVEFDATAGTSYRIVVDGWDGAAGRFRLAVNPPANDRFVGAIDLAAVGGGHEGTTVGATREAGEPGNAFVLGPASVWYGWTATVDGPVRVDVCREGESWDSVSARAYAGDALGSLHPVGTVGAAPACAAGGTRMTFHATDGSTYRFAVASRDGLEGPFRIAINVASNDDLAQAKALDGIDLTENGTTLGATREANEPVHGGEAGGHSVWYRWTAPARSPGTVALNTCGSDFDTLLGVYRGSHYTLAPTLEPVESGGPPPPCPPGEAGSRFDFPYEPGVTYRIAVDGRDAAAGEFQLALAATVPAPPNDDFVDAEPLDGLATTAFGNTWSATRETDEPAHGGEGSGSIWYSWTAPASADVTIDTCGSSFDTLLGVYTGVALETLTEVGVDADSAVCGAGGASTLSISATAGTTYWVAVDGDNDERGDVALRINRPANDDFADATVVGDTYATVTGTTAGATAESAEPLPVSFLPAAHTVWYRWTAPASEVVLLHTCTGAGEPMDVRVYEGDALDSLTAGSFSPPSRGCGHDPLEMATAVRSFEAIAGTTYSIAVDAPRDPFAPFDGRAGEGPFALAINPPANDLRISPRRVTGADATVSATNVGATREPGESDFGGEASGASVWFRWFAPAAGDVSIDTCGSAMETLLVVEADDDGPQPPPPGPLPPGVPACETGELGARYTFTTVEGRQYLIAVDGLDGATGDIDLTIESEEEDVTPPETAPIALPAALKHAEAYFAVERDEPGSTLECSVDGGPFAACVQLPHDGNVISFGVLAEGIHSVALRERDLAGNVDATPAEAELTVDLTPPDTEIVDVPDNPTRATTVSFVVGSSEEGGHFRCSIDGVAPSFCGSDGNVQLSGLAEGSHTLRVWAVDEAGNEDSTPAEHEFTIDRTAPTVAIASGPTLFISDPDATFELESSEAGTGFRCRLQRSGDPVASYVDCESPFEALSLLDGVHTLSVRGVDAAGNESSIVSRTFVVDTVAPQTTFMQAPPSATNDTSPTFDFTADEPAAGFRCALDDEPLDPCTAPIELGPLEDGPHSFEVEATDLAGNVETAPKQRIFTVDTVAPQTTIVSGPEGLTRELGPFSLSADESGADFECAVDGDPYEPCASPYTLPELPDGAHELSVRAVDRAGNVDPSAATRAIDLDRTAPTTTIDDGPEGIVGVTSVEFAFSADEPADFRCRLDGGPQIDCASPLEYEELDDGHHTFSVHAVDAAGNSEDPAVERAFRVEARPPETTLDAAPAAYTAATVAEFEFSADEEDSSFDCSLDGEPLAPCESPVVYEDLADGEHIFAVRAVDVGDNADPTAAEFAWTVDTTAPETSIDSGPSGLTRVAGPFAFSADEPTDRFECALDDGAFAPCSSGHTEGGLADGEHTLRVRAVDRADNVDATPAERQFTLDTVAPTVEITDGPGDVVGRDVALEFAASEPGSSFECRLDAQAYASCTSPQEYEDLDEGPHSVRVRATDAAGNTGPAAVAEFVVDVAPPETSIVSGPAGPTADATVAFGFTGTDAQAFRCSLDDEPFEGCESPVAYEDLPDGPHSVRVVAVDAAGNEDPTPAERSFTVDTVAPDTEITDGPDGPVHGQVSFSYSSSEGAGTFECSVNDGPFTSCTVAGLGAGEHVFRVRAVDPAGNRDPSPAERSFTIVNEKPVVDLVVSPDGGPARLDVEATFSAQDADEEDDELHYELQFGDGANSNGQLPDGPVAHRYDEPGIYTARLAVTDGIDTIVVTRTVTVTLPEPLEPKAGDDQTVIAGEPVILDGADSRPLRGIDSYRWSFGDGSPTESDPVVQHTYEDPGTYEAELTVEGPGETATDTARIKVLSRPSGDGVRVGVTSGGSGLPGADVVVMLPEERISAVTGANGIAKLYGLPDGEHKVYAYKSGYMPAAGNATAAGGEGSGEVELTEGQVATAEVDSRRMTLDEIIDAGIDPNDPDNQHVYQFEVHLNVTNPRGGIPPGGGGGGVGWGGYATRGGFIGGEGCVKIDAYSCRVETGGVTVINRLYWDEDAPIMSSLVIPFRATWLKEFYEVSLIVNNLGGEDFTLAGGNATITVPSGLSLAPTGEPQSHTTSVPDIPGGESRSARWILRGDKEGEYDLAASYAGSLEPFGRIVHIEGRTTDPVKVWGASALQLEVAVDEEVRDGFPFTVFVNLKNVSDVPVYNPAVELLKEGRVGYIEQPRQQRTFQVRELAPGDTHSAGPFVLVPEPSGDIDLANSFIRKTAGDVDLGGTIVTHEREPSFDETPSINARAREDAVVFELEGVADATGYEIFSTPDRETDFPDAALPATVLGPNKVMVSIDPGTRHWFAASTLRPGRNQEMIHPLVIDEASSTEIWPSMGASIGKCGINDQNLTVTMEDPDFDLTRWRYRIKDEEWQDGGELSGSTATKTIAVEIEDDPTLVRVQAQNTQHAAGNPGLQVDPGQWGGPVVTESLGRCNYVAIGDSVSAGEGIGYGHTWNSDRRWGHGGDGTWLTTRGLKHGEPIDHVGCHQRIEAHPRRLAELVGLRLTHLSCTGATFEEGIRGFQRKQEEVRAPAQVGGLKENPDFGEEENESFVNAKPDWVTLSLGMNDIKFARVVATCFYPIAVVLQRSTCDNSLSFAEDYLSGSTLQTNFERTYHRIRDIGDRANRRAVVLHTQYYDPLPDATQPQDCFDVYGGGFAGGYSRSEINRMREGLRKVNETIERAASQTPGVISVPAPDSFKDHRFCSDDPWVFGMDTGVDWRLADPDRAPMRPTPFHPTVEGQQKIAEQLERYVNASRQVGRAGSNVDVSYSSGERLRFAEVAQPGATLMVRTAEYQLPDHPEFAVRQGYQIETAADYSGDIQISLPGQAGDKMWHYTDGAWEDVQATFDGGMLQGTVTSLSPFAVGPEVEPVTAQITGGVGGVVPQEVDFSAAESSGPVDSITWDFGDGATGEGANVSHSYIYSGSYEVVATVRSAEGAVDRATTTVTITNPGPALVADVPESVQVGEDVVLDSSDSSDPNGTVVGGWWEIDGAIVEPEGQHSVLRFDEPGTVVVEGIVRDDELKEARRDFEIVITAAPDTTPPQTSIESGPSAGSTIADRTPTFTFSSSEPDSSFECRLDIGSFVACASPHTTAALGDGPHSFQVRAVDQSGNRDASPAERGFAVSVPPTTPPDGDGDGVSDGADRCPALMGPSQDGCPAGEPPLSPQPPLPRQLPRSSDDGATGNSPEAFSIGRRILVRKGKAVVTVSVPGAGVVAIRQHQPSGKRMRRRNGGKRKRPPRLIRPVRRRLRAAGRARIVVPPTKAGKRLLRKRGRLVVRLRIVYTGSDGTSLAWTKRVVIRVPQGERASRRP